MQNRILFSFVPKDMFLLSFREIERDRETSFGCLPYVPEPGIKPAALRYSGLYAPTK